MDTHLERLRMQVKAASTHIKKLEFELINAKQDISLLQSVNAFNLSSGSPMKTGLQSKVNGRSFRYHYSKH